MQAAKANLNRRRALKAFVLTLCLAPLIHASSAIAGNGNNPGVTPPQASAYGKTYGEWSAEWWKWCFSMPVDSHPLFDTADASAGQSGKVWFLGGTFTVIEGEDGSTVGTAVRECTVPTGTALFFPILNSECSTVEGNGETEAELRDCATFFGSAVANPNSNLECTVDGKPVSNLLDYRVQSPLFSYGPLPENNLLEGFGLEAPAGTVSPAVGDGVYVMLAPLSKGSHTLHFSGSSIFTEEEHEFDFVFRLDITYYITVK